MTNFLIRDNFKIARKGSKVQASAEAGEFIYSTGDSSVALAVLKEIAQANKIEISSKLKKDQFQSKLDEALTAMSNVPEQEENTQTEQVNEIVKAGVEAGKSDDDILIEIIQAGISFRRAGRMFKEALETLGLRASTKDVKEQAATILEDMEFAPTEYNEVEAAVKAILDNVEGANEKQAMTAIRAFAKENEIELPKRPRGRRGAVGVRGRVFDFIKQNPNLDETELGEFISRELDKDEEATARMVKRFAPIAKLVSEAVALHTAES